MSGIILNRSSILLNEVESPNQARACQYGWSGQPVCSGHLLHLPSKAWITSKPPCLSGIWISFGFPTPVLTQTQQAL